MTPKKPTPEPEPKVIVREPVERRSGYLSVVKAAPALIGALVTLIAAISAASIAIIHELKDTKEKVEVEAKREETAGVKRDEKIQEIHLLVNSRLLVVLRMLVAVTKKEADRTKNPADIRLYEEALRELQQAEASTKAVAARNQEVQRNREDREDEDAVRQHEEEDGSPRGPPR